MTEALKCPTCSAPLDYPTDGGPAVHCPYCNSTVLLPGFSPSGVKKVAGNVTPGLRQLLDKRAELAEIALLLRAGKKIEAIRIYRRAFGADLLTAKNAVENLQAGRPAVFSRTTTSGDVVLQVTKVATSAMSFGCGLAIVIALMTAGIVGFAMWSVHRGLQAARQTWTPQIGPKKTPAAVPAVPSFAHMTMEFGSMGIGAGQFKDSRSIAVDGAGHIYVGEYSDGRVQVFDAQGKFIKTWNLGPKKYLFNLAADRHGTVYAVTPGHIFAFEGATGLSFGEAAVTNDETTEYYKDAYAALNGDLYAIGGASHIVILSADGKIKSTIKASEKVGQDVTFERIVVNGLGEIYALDRKQGIFKFAPDGRYINRFGGGEDAGVENLSAAHNLAIDGHGRIYVSDTGNSSAILVFDGNGRYLDSFGGNDVIFGLAINDQNEILACCRNQHVIRKFVVNGQ